MIFESPRDPVTIPDVSLTELVLSRVDRHPDRAAFVDGPTGRRVTFGGLRDAIRAARRSSGPAGSGPETCWGS